MVDIVIVNWNSGKYLEKCISSILSNQGVEYIEKIIVVDNNSSDSSIDFLKVITGVIVIQNKKNLGFAKACNQGFLMCSSEFVLLLNPDAMVMNNTIKDCINFMQQNQGIDILGCALLDDNGNISKSCSRFPTAIRIFFDAAGLSKVAPFLFKPSTLMTDWDHSESRKVDQVMGAFMFMKTSIFEKIGYFDERFFVYYEELDFSYRLSLHGGMSFFNPLIKAVHSGEGTTSSVKAFRLYLSLQSRLKYAKKHFNYFSYLLVLISTFPIEFFSRLMFFILSFRFPEIKQLTKGYVMLFKNNRNTYLIK